MKPKHRIFSVVGAVVAAGVVAACHPEPLPTTRVSVATDGTEGNGPSGFSPAVSRDGAVVAFGSAASNLVEGDTNGVADVLVRDRRSETTERVSVSSAGAQGNGLSFSPAISHSGRVVAFYSDASNLVRGDDNGRGDVFVHDRGTGLTEQVSVSSDGVGGNALSAATASPGISARGRFVAFQSFADNLVAGDVNGTDDVFVRDRERRRTVLVTRGIDGPANGPSFGPALSGDGRWVTFASSASNLVHGDSNGAVDQFVHDLRTGATELVSVGPAGCAADGSVAPFSGSSLSRDGSVVAYASHATNLVDGDHNGVADVFLHDRRTGSTTRVSVAADGTEANGESGFPQLSSKGDVVAFESVASNLVDDDRNGLNDVFLARVTDGAIRRVGLMFDPSGDVPPGDGTNLADTFFQPSISANGGHVAFFSEATTLVADDRNGVADAFVVHTRAVMSRTAPPAPPPGRRRGPPERCCSASVDVSAGVATGS